MNSHPLMSTQNDSEDCLYSWSIVDNSLVTLELS
jgi:hypothetical protein